MEKNKQFLEDFKSSITKLDEKQNGNFVEDLNEQVQWPNETFFHLLCRKIDIRKRLFISYDTVKDLTPTNEILLDDNGWLKVIYILAYWTFSDNLITIKYKALNTLLKAMDLISNRCKENKFVSETYNISINLL